MNIFSKEVRQFLDDTYAKSLKFGDESAALNNETYDVITINVDSCKELDKVINSVKTRTRLLLFIGNTPPGYIRDKILPIVKDAPIGKTLFVAFRSNDVKETKKMVVSGVTDRCAFVAANLLSFLGNRILILNSFEAVEIANICINRKNNDNKLLYLYDLKDMCKEFNVNMWDIFDSI